MTTDRCPTPDAADGGEGDVFGRHEVVHSALIAAEMFERYVADHPALATEPDLQRVAANTSEALYEFYQRVAAEFVIAEER